MEVLVGVALILLGFALGSVCGFVACACGIAFRDMKARAELSERTVQALRDQPPHEALGDIMDRSVQ